MANTKIPVELSSTPGIVDNSNATAITIDSSENTTFSNSIIFSDSAYSAAYSIRRNANALILSGGTSGYYFNRSDNSATDLYIDGSGNVGIGVTNPSDYYSTDLVVSSANEQGITLAATSTSDANYLMFADGTSGDARFVGHVGYDHSADNLFLRSGGLVSFKTGGGTERMRIDAGGRVMIAETSNSGYSANADDLIIGDNGSATERGISIGATSGGSIRWNDGADAGSIEYAHSDNSMRLHTAGAERLRITSSGVVDIKSGGTSSAPSLIFEGDTNTGLFHGGDTLGFSTAGSEAMRIDSSGNLLINNSTGAGGTPPNSGFVLETGGNIKFRVSSNGSAASQYYNASGTIVGSVVVNASSTAYNTSSDARLKDVTGEARGLEVINELNPVAYNWKADGKADEGLIAQEVLNIVPNAVSGSEEEYYQMDYSKLVVHLVAGMKEQQAQIEALQSEINELKNS